MSKPRSSPFPAITSPFLAIVAGDKGGVGKSLLSLVLADTAFLHDVPLRVLQIDVQARLSRALGTEVTTIRIDLKEARRDAAAAARRYTPIYAAVESMRTTGTSVLIDVGANEASGLAQWLGLVELAEDLDAWESPVVVLVPFVAEGEAIRQAGRTARMFMARLPSATIVLVENERDGRMSTLHPASDAMAAFRSDLRPLQKVAATIRMPLIEAGSWRPFEAAGSRLVGVAGMSAEEVMTLTGLARAEAKIVRGDVAAWFAGVSADLCEIIQFDREARR